MNPKRAAREGDIVNRGIKNGRNEETPVKLRTPPYGQGKGKGVRIVGSPQYEKGVAGIKKEGKKILWFRRGGGGGGTADSSGVKFENRKQDNRKKQRNGE